MGSGALECPPGCSASAEDREQPVVVTGLAHVHHLGLSGPPSEGRGGEDVVGPPVDVDAAAVAGGGHPGGAGGAVGEEVYPAIGEEGVHHVEARRVPVLVDSGPEDPLSEVVRIGIVSADGVEITGQHDLSAELAEMSAQRFDLAEAGLLVVAVEVGHEHSQGRSRALHPSLEEGVPLPSRVGQHTHLGEGPARQEPDMVAGAAAPRAGRPEGAVGQAQGGAELGEVSRRPTQALLEGQQVGSTGLHAGAEHRQAALPTLKDVLAEDAERGRAEGE